MNKEIDPNLEDLKELANKILSIENKIKLLIKSKKELGKEFLDISKNTMIYDLDDESLKCLYLLENENLGYKKEYLDPFDSIKEWLYCLINFIDLDIDLNNEKNKKEMLEMLQNIFDEIEELY